MAETHVENPDHDSLFVKFEQLERLLNEIIRPSQQSGIIVKPKYYAVDALQLTQEIRKTVLK